MEIFNAKTFSALNSRWCLKTVFCLLIHTDFQDWLKVFVAPKRYRRYKKLSLNLTTRLLLYLITFINVRDEKYSAHAQGSLLGKQHKKKFILARTNKKMFSSLKIYKFSLFNFHGWIRRFSFASLNVMLNRKIGRAFAWIRSRFHADCGGFVDSFCLLWFLNFAESFCAEKVEWIF